MQRTLGLLALSMLLVAALPASAQVVKYDLVGTEGPASDTNPCRPYHQGDPVLKVYCTAKGSSRAVTMFLDNVTDGNYTTTKELYDGVDLMLYRIETCKDHPSDPDCPTGLLDAVRP